MRVKHSYNRIRQALARSLEKRACRHRLTCSASSLGVTSSLELRGLSLQQLALSLLATGKLASNSIVVEYLIDFVLGALCGFVIANLIMWIVDQWIFKKR